MDYDHYDLDFPGQGCSLLVSHSDVETQSKVKRFDRYRLYFSGVLEQAPMMYDEISLRIANAIITGSSLFSRLFRYWKGVASFTDVFLCVLVLDSLQQTKGGMVNPADAIPTDYLSPTLFLWAYGNLCSGSHHTADSDDNFHGSRWELSLCHRTSFSDTENCTWLRPSICRLGLMALQADAPAPVPLLDQPSATALS